MEDRKDYGTSDHPMTRTELRVEPRAEKPGGLHWTEAFSGRELMEIQFARVYHGEFGHGTPGHLHLMLISQLSKIIDELTGRSVHKEGQDQVGA